MQQPPNAPDLQGNNEVEFFSIENMQNNNKMFNFCHTFMCIVGGCIAGIAGLTGGSGFLLFLCVFLTTSCGILCRIRFKLEDYSNLKMHAFLLQGISSHGLSYVLFLTLAYALVHIY